MKLTWREVFDSHKMFPSDYLTCVKKAMEVNYDYIAFNGRVCSVKDSIEDFICMVEDLDIPVIKDYDKEQDGDNDSKLLMNNTEIYEVESMICLTSREITKLQLFINPISTEIFRYFENEKCFKVDANYRYEAY
ncbi:hypothetical protein [Clostridium tagluense]|uniref:Uncharacterized protein n=1 Tax=Clostridium tagluense TaxID=360422 RepID=A0A401UQ61_9CLOT|nr:hypothetical protein [Clostridium tagluense]GCD11693.1 hypothetical protein Ctaglu_33160 [Clostridium tagluense]